MNNESIIRLDDVNPKNKKKFIKIPTISIKKLKEAHKIIAGKNFKKVIFMNLFSINLT